MIHNYIYIFIIDLLMAICCFVFDKWLFLYFLGKKRRLTFMECNNDINTMIDLAKVADLVSSSLHSKWVDFYNCMKELISVKCEAVLLNKTICVLCNILNCTYFVVSIVLF